MKFLQAPLQELADYQNMRDILVRKGGNLEVTGCAESQKWHLMYGLCEDFDVKIIVTFSDLKAKEICDDVRFYDKRVCFYPAKDLIFYQADICGNQITAERMKVFRRILEGEQITIVTTIDAFMTPQVPLRVLKDNVISLRKGAILQEEALAMKLTGMGYTRNYQVEEAGQFSIRGGIIDIFDLTEENPYRIEMWGDEIDSIRRFDILSQRSIEKLKEVVIYPALEMVLSDAVTHEGIKRIGKDAEKTEKALRAEFRTEEAHRIHKMFAELKEQVEEFSSHVNLESYIRYFYPDCESFLQLFDERKSCIILDEINKTDSHGKAVEAEFIDSMTHRAEKGYALPEQMNILQPIKKTWALLQKKPILSLSGSDFQKGPISFANRFPVQARSVASYNGSLPELKRDLNGYRKRGYRVLLLSASRTRAKRMAQDLMDEGIMAFYSENPDRELSPGEVMVYYGGMKHGFEYPLLNFVVLSDMDIFGVKKKQKQHKKLYSGQKIRDYAELKVGDYVVHETYGVGIYRGIEKIENNRVVKDYMKVEYKDGANLYVLATSFDLIQKYASSDAAKSPKLNRLGTPEWTRTKGKVKLAVESVAKELVELYAARQAQSGYRFSKDTVWQKEFEELFPYDETEDQLAAIEATKKDMESGVIMERLICGDVGYGKTEIAIRAAFKAVMDGKQVVFLVPTTILAQQHYTTFVQRMKDFPIKIELLSRFRSSKEQKKSIENMKKGNSDIVIGTHRVLSADVGFKDLGLLIVDEEQRFGVTHKEKIKNLRKDVDVLTLTATPIPRTLHMSLIGIRDMSVLEEAPGERLPIQTFVMEYNEEMVREAIVREISRGGQVYYVYNRVDSIADVAAGIQRLVPEANVAFAHGQMKESELERIMFDFVEGEINVLVSTTIIETGLDISNVNTMIIHDSDRLGLSQLYQLRGRVGRSNRTAYAFLMYRRDKILSEVAEKRLQAIREFTELGSGFKISMRDLEIRGAGNLLGFKQHGHMEAVGYDLYCKMLNEAVSREKGIKVADDFETTVDLDVAAYIPYEYIVNEVQKLDMYQRIAGIGGKADCEEMQEELIDRFGALPKAAENLLRIALLRVRAHKLYITEITGKLGEIRIVFKNDAPVAVEKIPEVISNYKGKLAFVTKGKPGFILQYQKYGLQERDEMVLLEKTERLVEDLLILLPDTEA